MLPSPINIGGAGVLFSFFDAGKGGHRESGVINVVIAIAVEVTEYICLGTPHPQLPGSDLLASSGHPSKSSQTPSPSASLLDAHVCPKVSVPSNS